MLRAQLIQKSLKVSPEHTISMVYVQGGKFLYQGKIETTLSPFWISQYQLSQKLYREIMGHNPSSFQGDELPVERVSWHDTQRFIQKLNENLNLEGDNLFRLPTEAEWEYAARGGRYDLESEYSGSSKIDKVASYYWENTHFESQLRGLKAPNELGLYDMSGNVWEWCQDWYDDYEEESMKDPQGPETGLRRVLRGGSWRFNESLCRVSFRFDRFPDARRNGCGFRLARTAFEE